MTLSRSIYVAASGIILFFLIAEKYSIVYIYHILFIHSSVDGHLRGFLSGCSEECCSEYWEACILLDHVFLQVYAQKWDCGVIR